MYLNVDRQRVADQWPPECRLQYWRRGAICLDSCDETLDSANLGLETGTGTRRGVAVVQCWNKSRDLCLHTQPIHRIVALLVLPLQNITVQKGKDLISYANIVKLKLNNLVCINRE